MIVDDEEEVHQVTKLVLNQFAYEGKPLQFISAYTAQEAQEMIKAHPDTAVILLDVVMEKDDAGLRFVHYVRDAMLNKNVRIILRTGQPGQAPEKRVIQDYDINDYKEKTELTAQKLYSSVYTSLKTYNMMSEIEASKMQLQQYAHALTYVNESLEQKVKIKTQHLEEKNRALRESIWGTMTAMVEVSVLEERTKMAKEIHDIAGHTFTGTIVQCEWLKHLIQEEPEQALLKADQLQNHLRQGLEKIRATVKTVYTNARDSHVEFHRLVRHLLEETERHMHVTIGYKQKNQDELEQLPTDLQKLLFHALQEGLTNGIRHGKSTEFQFKLIYKNGLIDFQLQDNGIGTDHVTYGFGLTMMQEQVEAWNGEFFFQSKPGKGSTLSIVIPYERSATNTRGETATGELNISRMNSS